MCSYRAVRSFHLTAKEQVITKQFAKHNAYRFLCASYNIHMRALLTLIFIFISLTASAQFTDTVYQYFNYDWERIVPKRKKYVYFRIARKTDDGRWLVQNYERASGNMLMEGIFLDDSLTIKDGRFHYYYHNGQLKSECSYNKNNLVGLYREYSFRGKLIDSSRYKHTGIPFHKSFKWDAFGRLSAYAEYDMEGNGTGYATEYYEDSTISSYGKYSTGHLKDSVWTYYRTDGSLAFSETFDNGQLTSWQCYNADGTINKDNCDTTSRAPKTEYDLFPYLGMNTRMPTEAKEGGVTGTHKVTIAFYIDKSGNITDPYVAIGSYIFFNREALRVISNMPKWEPAFNKNRYVKTYCSLPMAFSFE